MLVLSRKTGERIAIGDAVVVTVLRLSGGRVRLGITAPADISVLRTEVASEEAPGVRREELSFARNAEPRSTCKVRSRR